MERPGLQEIRDDCADFFREREQYEDSEENIEKTTNESFGEDNNMEKKILS